MLNYPIKKKYQYPWYYLRNQKGPFNNGRFKAELSSLKDLPVNPDLGDVYLIDGIIYTFVGEFWHVKKTKHKDPQQSLDLSL